MKKQLRFKVYCEEQNIFDFKTDNIKEAKKKFKNIWGKFE